MLTSRDFRQRAFDAHYDGFDPTANELAWIETGKPVLFIWVCARLINTARAIEEAYEAGVKQGLAENPSKCE